MKNFSRIVKTETEKQTIQTQSYQTYSVDENLTKPSSQVRTSSQSVISIIWLFSMYLASENSGFEDSAITHKRF